MESHLEDKFKDIKDEQIFHDQIIYGSNCHRITKDGKIKKNMIFMDLEEDNFLIFFNLNEAKKDRLNIHSVIDVIITNKLREKNKPEFYKNNSKKINQNKINKLYH